MQFSERNLAETWRKWEQQFRTYFAAAELDSKPKKTQTAILLHVAGPESQEIYQTFAFDPLGEDEEDPRDDRDCPLKVL